MRLSIDHWARYVSVAVLTFGVAAVGSTSGASFSHLGGLPSASSSRALGVSGDGHVVIGQTTTPQGTQGFRCVDGVMYGLGIPAGKIGTVANAASFDGSVIVGTISSTNGTEAFRWQGGTMTSLGDLPGGQVRSSAHAVSADGTVVIGTGWGYTGPLAFRWTGGVMVSLGDLPGGGIFSNGNGCSLDGSTAVGLGFSSRGPEACMWRGAPSALGDLAGGDFNSVAYGVSGNGAVVVGVGTSANGSEAFRWQNNTIVGLGDLPGGNFASTATAISSDGRIIVGNASGPNGPVAFIWDAENGMRELKSVLAGVYGLDMTGWSVREATAVSADGTTIVGSAVNPSGNLEAFTARIPLPGSVSGRINLSGYVGDWSTVAMNVEIHNVGSDISLLNRSINVDGDGSFDLATSLRGSFDVYVSGGTWLRKKIGNVTITSAGVGGLNVALLNGDVDGDNEVTLADYSQVAAAFGKTTDDAGFNSRADLNGDGEISLADYALVAGNMGASGD